MWSEEIRRISYSEGEAVAFFIINGMLILYCVKTDK
jgi:hypothetical protein